MPLTKVSFSVIQVANNVTSTTVGNTTSIPSFTFDQNGVITSASNTAISGAGITANTVANSAFQTGSVENYLRGANLDFGMRNRIINGAMRIDQRNSGANVSLSSSETFVTDRYVVQTATGSGNIGAQSTTAPAGFVNSLRVRVGTGASPSAGHLNSIFQIIEGTNCADLGWGTANARPVTLSFQVRSTVAGTFSGSLRNYSGNRSYPFTYTINSASTWENETITISGDTAGSWNSNGSGGICVFFDLGSGSNSQGTAGAWAAADRRAATGSTQLVATSGAEFFITGVQLEEGSVPTPFEYRPFGTELALCQRYFEVCDMPFYYMNNSLNVDLYHFTPFKVTKRATPTVTATTTLQYFSNASSANFSPTLTGSVNQIFIAATGLSNAQGMVGQQSVLRASIEL